MGWKRVKEHYKIGHSLHVTAEGIAIGSSLISDIMVIDAGGKLVKRYSNRSNPDLLRYMAEMDADPDKLRELVLAPDEFEVHIPIFTYEGAEILTKYCEALGYPNVTHDGMMMYENRFSTDHAKVVEWAKRNARSGVKLFRDSVADAEEKLAKYRGFLAAEEAAVAKLEADYPTSSADVPTAAS